MGQVKILHISDTHFGSHDEQKCKAVVKFASSWRPDIVVVTGDIVDSPLWSAYFDKATTFINTIGKMCDNKIFCIPGNHDALLGRLFLWRFWRKLHLNTSNVYYTTIRGQGICLICVDTTHLTLRHLNNSGLFDRIRESKLEHELRILRQDPANDLDRAIAVALAHHHPLPTITAAAEKMLYFKNSGLFLRFAVRHAVRLILHGHQHDPHFTKLSFGSDQDDDMIGVLSAGSCVKADHGGEEYSGCGHFYAVMIDSERARVTSYYYHRSVERFVALDEFLVSRIATSDPRLVTLDQSFTVTKQGHMKACESRRYERTKDGEDVVIFAIGADDESDACLARALRLTVKVDGRPVRCSCLKDEPRSKWFQVPVGAGQRGALFEVVIDYTWPGGFRRLLTRSIDSGEFTIRNKGVKWCKVALDLEERGLQLHPLDVYCVDRTKIERSASRDRHDSFTIREPTGHISWTARITTAPPQVVDGR
jgi:3',5'-cyclic AMP phosphodiesterase CpdA